MNFTCSAGLENTSLELIPILVKATPAVSPAMSRKRSKLLKSVPGEADRWPSCAATRVGKGATATASSSSASAIEEREDSSVTTSPPAREGTRHCTNWADTLCALFVICAVGPE